MTALPPDADLQSTHSKRAATASASGEDAWERRANSGLRKGRWIGWRLRALVAAALCGCLALLLLVRALGAVPALDEALYGDDSGVLRLGAPSSPSQAVRSLVDGSGSAFALAAFGPGGAAMGAIFALSSQFVIALPLGTRPVEIVQIPTEGLPKVTQANVAVAPGQVNSFRTVIDTAPPRTAQPSDAPHVSAIEFGFDSENRPEIILTGERFLYGTPTITIPDGTTPVAIPSDLGGRVEDLKVNFTTNNYRVTVEGAGYISVFEKQTVAGTQQWVLVSRYQSANVGFSLTGNNTKLHIPVPQQVILRLSSIEIVRPQTLITTTDGGRPTSKTVEKLSNTISLKGNS